MAIHWKIPFVTRKGTTMSVNIYDDTYSGDPLVLWGAATPFQTREEKSDDILKPTRLSTGYIRIMTGQTQDGTDFDASLLFPPTPMARPVRLTKADGTLMWQGFIRQESFTQDWLPDPEELELPICSALSMLGGIQITETALSSYLSNGRARFKDLLYLALQQLPSPISYYYVYYPQDVSQSGTFDQTFLTMGLQIRNWFEYEDENFIDMSSIRFDGATWLSLLSDVAEAFGYTLTESGRDIMFVSRRATTYARVDVSDLTLPYTSLTYVNYNAYNRTIGASSLYDNKGKVSLLQSARRAVVEAEINSIQDEDSLPQPASRRHLTYYERGDFEILRNSLITNQANPLYYKYVYLYEPLAGDNYWTFHTYENYSTEDWIVEDITMSDRSSAAFIMDKDGNTSVFCYYCTLKDEYQETPAGSDGVMFAINSDVSTFFIGGKIKVTGKVICYDEAVYHPIGEPDTWLSHDITSRDVIIIMVLGSVNIQKTVVIDNEDGYLKETATSKEDGVYFDIPAGGVFGSCQIFVYCPHSHSDYGTDVIQGAYEFQDLKVDYEASPRAVYAYYPADDNNRFVINLNAAAEDDCNIEPRLASYIKGRNGYGIPIKPDYSELISTLAFAGSTQTYMEGYLCETIQQLRAVAHRMLEVTIFVGSDLTYRPTDIVNFAGSHWLIMSQSRNWRDSTNTLTLYEIIS